MDKIKFGEVCKHGSLRRKCNECDLEDENARLESENAHLRKVNGITLKKNTIKQSLVFANEVISRLENREKEARGMLSQLEWITSEEISPDWCHICEVARTSGHKPACRIDRWLKEE